MIIEVEGIIISEVAYGETSKIINVYTKEKGIIGIICKGAKSPKNKCRVFTMRFTYGVFNVYYKEKKLSTLISVDPVNNLSNIKSDITLMGYLTYITELVTQIYKQNEDKNIYNLYITGILKIEEDFPIVELKNPEIMVAPGQAAVFYDNQRLLGGGWILNNTEKVKIKII